MPGLNKTGPNGRGPMTGGRRGRCEGGAGEEAAPALITDQQLEVSESNPASESKENPPGIIGEAGELRGVGRGGAPRGGGRGRRFGGGRNGDGTVGARHRNRRGRGHRS